jgi:hypothetical protein
MNKKTKKKDLAGYYLGVNFDIDPNSPVYEDCTDAAFYKNMETIANEAFEKEREIIQEFINHMGFEELDDKENEEQNEQRSD